MIINLKNINIKFSEKIDSTNNIVRVKKSWTYENMKKGMNNYWESLCLI